MKIQVCSGRTCSERYSEYILKRLNADKEVFELENCIIETCPCTGNCQKGPNVVIDGKIEHYMNPIKASKIIVANKRTKKKQEKIFTLEEASGTPTNFKLVGKNEDAPEENIYIKDHINIIHSPDDTTDL